jgi:two-component system, NtrC family, sensor histidine kinase PilS
MMLESEAVNEPRTDAQMLWWFIIGRLAVSVALLLLSGVPWHRESFGAAERGSLPIFIAVVAFSLFYSVALRFSSNLRLQAILQLTVDLVLITWLVRITGDVQSPFAALYIIHISVASILLGPKGATVSSVACALAFTLVSMATLTGLIRPSGQVVSGTTLLKAIQTVGLNDIAFLAVGVLSARLAERKTSSDVKLFAATQTLANLRALHERIVESIRSGVVTTDLEGRIYTFNAAAEEITGYKVSDIRGQNISVLFGNLESMVEESLDAAHEGVPSPRFECDCLTSEGLGLRLGFSIFPLFAETRETTGLVITFQDLTQVRSLEASSRRQDRLAAVGRVAASIAHEIRNPLAAMRGSIQVLRSEVDGDSTQAQLMEIILSESDRLNRIITDYLTYARPRAHTLVNVDINELLSETFTLLRHDPTVRENHLLETDLPNRPMMVHADPAQLKQVFWNLARNALQAMPGGGSFRATLEPRPHGKLRITFVDTGQGMSPEQVEHLFEPFSSRTGGTGLGLSIVYQIIREHNGTINVRSREGQGTTITIDLPADSSG